jgi:hypothetical protein
MPRSGSIPSDIVQVLRGRRNGATLHEIRAALRARRGEVLPHSVRSAIYAHLDQNGEQLFAKVGSGKRSGRYRLRT